VINVYHLTEAVPAALFGMFALWAAASKRHWFVRTAVVAAALLVVLLIPAHEVVVEFGVMVLLVVVGLAIWRRRKREISTENADPYSGFRLRLSLETLMLLTVIVAVVTAVAASAPIWNVYQWLRMILTGTMAAVIGLACVWVICGRSPWQLRAVAAPLLAVSFGALLHILMTAANVWQSWMQSSGSFSQYWDSVKRDVWHGGPYWITASAVGTAIFCGWLFFVRRAGWFDPFDELIDEPRVTDRARWAAVLFFIAVSLFPLALFYRLLTPTQIPAVKLPKPNGFDDFVAAGRMIGAVDGAKLARSDLLSDKERRTILARHAAAIDRMRLGLQKGCWHPFGYIPKTTDDEVAVGHLISALAVRGALADRDGSVEERLTAYWDWLRVCVESDRGTGTTYSIPAQLEGGAVLGLANIRTRLSAQQCIELAADLWNLEASRESWQVRSQRQRIIDENVDWQWRLQATLADWSGTERYEWARSAQLRRMTEMRILIAELGIRAHKLDTGRVPTTLTELVPKYLPAIPDDPYGNGAVKYAVSANGYTLYSIGPDGDDDRGRPIVNQRGTEDGDLTNADLLPNTAGSNWLSTDVAETNGGRR
jgi:hypothetical protein